MSKEQHNKIQNLGLDNTKVQNNSFNLNNKELKPIAISNHKRNIDDSDDESIWFPGDIKDLLGEDAFPYGEPA